MKVRDLIRQLESLNDEAKDKEIKIICPNGLQVTPCLKFELNNKYDVLNYSQENIKQYFLTWG